MCLYVNTFTHFCIMSNKVSTFHANIPECFRTIKQPPNALYYRGQSLESILQKPRVAIVGARKATSYGLEVTKQLSTSLSRQGIVIVSGLAFGIDAAAHKATLDAGGTTVAVLPSSLESVYPHSHHRLAEQIAQQGTLLTEIESRQPIHKHQFIARNRLIAALSDVVIIVEAAEKSGALHTATFAKEQGKIVAAVPGNITNSSSTGTNNLIREGAALITCAEDVMQLLNITPAKTTSYAALCQDERAIVHCIQNGKNTTSDIVANTKMPPQKCSQILTMLEIKGILQSTSTGTWHVTP